MGNDHGAPRCARNFIYPSTGHEPRPGRLQDGLRRRHPCANPARQEAADSSAYSRASTNVPTRWDSTSLAEAVAMLSS